MTFFTQTLKAYISSTNWPIDLNFFMVTSYDLVYWCVKFQEIQVSTTTRTSLPTQKFQKSVGIKIFDEIFWNFAWTTIQPLDKSWVSCTAIMLFLWPLPHKTFFSKFMWRRKAICLPCRTTRMFREWVCVPRLVSYAEGHLSHANTQQFSINKKKILLLFWFWETFLREAAVSDR